MVQLVVEKIYHYQVEYHYPISEEILKKLLN